MKDFFKGFFNNKEKGKVKNIILSVALGTSMLTNLYLYTSGPQNIPQNIQVVTASEDYQKQVENLKKEKDSLSTNIKDLTTQKDEAQTKLNSALEENKSLNSKLSQMQSQISQEQTNAQSSQQESKGNQQQVQQVHNDNSNNYVVYKTKTGSKYHSAGCGYLSRSCYETTRSAAQSEGLTPCSRCNP